MKRMSKKNQYLLPLYLSALYNNKGTLPLNLLFKSTNFQMPEAVLLLKFGSMVASEPVLLNPTKSNNVSRIAQLEHLFLSIIVGLPHIRDSPTV